MYGALQLLSIIQINLKKHETRSTRRINSQQKDATPRRASSTDSDEDPQETTNNDLQQGQTRAATPWNDPETGELGHAIKVEETIVETIETDDPGVLAEAETPQSPPFGTPSRQNAVYYSPPAEARVAGDFGPSQLTPRMAAKTLLWVKSSECGYAKRAYLGSCMTPMQFVDTIMGLWDIQGDLTALRTVTYKVEGAPWPVLMSDDIVGGHETMMGEIGAWWERSGKGDDRCMVAVSITL